MSEPIELFTIGHSAHPLERFLALLGQHGVEAIADIRRFPGSKAHPHFQRENLMVELPRAGIDYLWLEALGGRRPKLPGESLNLGLRNDAFRNYADYMATPEFQAGLDQLLELGRRKRTASMCAEGLFWQCHRRLVSDLLLANGHSVRHIMPAGQVRPHTLTEGAKVEEGRVTYPAEKMLFE